MRLNFIRWLFFLCLLLITLRLFYWQILSHDDLVARAEGQRIIKRVVVAPRGSILFSDGSILAGSEPAFSVFVQPKDIEAEISKKFTDERKTDLLTAEPPSEVKNVVSLYKNDLKTKLAKFFNDLDFKDYESTGNTFSLDCFQGQF